MAQSKSFEGPSIGLFGSMIGAEVDGKITDSNGAVSTGSIGKVTPVAGIDASYTFATGSNGFFGVGAWLAHFCAELGLYGLVDAHDFAPSEAGNRKCPLRDSLDFESMIDARVDGGVYGVTDDARTAARSIAAALLCAASLTSPRRRHGRIVSVPDARQ
jgi:hypothetical protein